MSFQDFFRSFIGLNSRNGGQGDPVNKFRNPPWGDDPDEDDDFDELYSDYRTGTPGQNGFNVFTGDAMQMHKYFEQQMNEIMKSFGSLGAFDFGPGMGGFQIPSNELNDNSKSSPDARDRYLKTPLDRPRFALSDRKTDSDIDDRVTTDDIGALLKKEPSAKYESVPFAGTSSRCFTSRVIIQNNGRVEERVKEWNSDGVEREHIRRTLGDQTHSVTTSKDKSGQLQTEEQLINMDQNTLTDFDKKWSFANGGESNGVTRLPAITPSTDEKSSVFSSLLRLFS